jgi:hypothetical protein
MDIAHLAGSGRRRMKDLSARPAIAYRHIARAFCRYSVRVKSTLMPAFDARPATKRAGRTRNAAGFKLIRAPARPDSK